MGEMSGPELTNVWYHDQVNQPGNWDEMRFGMWFPRRLVMVQIPGLHSERTKHRVVLAFIPENDPLPANFVNRFGFTQQGINRLVDFGCLDDKCPIGLRTNSACAHVGTAVILLGLYSYDNQVIDGVYKNLHWLDVKHPNGLNQELCLQ